MGTAQPLWAACSNALPSSLYTIVSSRGKSSFSKQSEGFLFHFMPASMRNHREEPSWLVLAGHPEPSQGWFPQPLLTTGAQDHFSVPLLNSLLFVDAFPV